MFSRATMLVVAGMAVLIVYLGADSKEIDHRAGTSKQDSTAITPAVPTYLMPANPKKLLIHFGQDMPTPKGLRQNIRSMENDSPFSGVVFRVPIPLKAKDGKDLFLHKVIFGSEKVDWKDHLQSQLEAMREVEFRQFTDNFLRMNLEPGTVDWYDDWSAVLHNARMSARFAKQSPNCKGIIIDTEPYDGRILTYVTRPQKDRYSLTEYSQQVKKRASELMHAIREEYPDAVIFITWGYEKISKSESPTTKVGKLLPPFLDGILAAAGPSTVFVEGFERSYSYKDEPSFIEGREQMLEGNLRLTTEPEAYKKHLSVGFSLSVDWPHQPGTFSTTSFEENFFQPEEFEKALGYAIKHSDKYVWLYNQKASTWFPRILPDAYRDAIWRAQIASERPAAEPATSLKNAK